MMMNVHDVNDHVPVMMTVMIALNVGLDDEINDAYYNGDNNYGDALMVCLKWITL